MSQTKTVKIIINRLNKLEGITGIVDKADERKYYIQISVRKRRTMTTKPKNFGVCSKD